MFVKDVRKKKENKGGEIMEYTFEKVSGEKLYQVRLNGEFVTYVNENKPEIVDRRLKENGWDSREDYFNYLSQTTSKLGG